MNWFASSFLLAAGMLICGCLRHVEPARPEGVRGSAPERRDCPANDTPFAEVSWLEFRPFRMLMPTNVEVDCCCECLDFGRVDMMVPGVSLWASIVVLGASGGEISAMLEEYQLIAETQKKSRNGVVWYMERQYPDRRLLMDMQGSSLVGWKLRCCCEIDSGECLMVQVESDAEFAATTCEWIWRLCRSLKIDIKCFDTFSCLKRPDQPDSNVFATRKLPWGDGGLDSEDFEWKQIRCFRIYLPSKVNVEHCCVDHDSFVFDMPYSSHYVTVCCSDEGSDDIDDKIDFYSYSSADLNGDLSLDIKRKILISIALREMAGIDYYMEKRFSDRRLLVEHRHQSIDREGVACYCEFYGGPHVSFRVRGSGVVDRKDFEWILMVCRNFKIEMFDEK